MLSMHLIVSRVRRNKCVVTNVIISVVLRTRTYIIGARVSALLCDVKAM